MPIWVRKVQPYPWQKITLPAVGAEIPQFPNAEMTAGSTSPDSAGPAIAASAMSKANATRIGSPSSSNDAPAGAVDL